MKLIDLIEVLQTIKPDIKVKITEGTPDVSQFKIIDGKSSLKTIVDPGFNYDVELNGFYITYNETETTRPTQEEIMAVLNGNK